MARTTDTTFHFVTDTGEDAVPTYGGVANIDHQVSDALDGDCWAAGVDPGHPAVLGTPYFDLNPVACTLSLP